MKHMNLISAAMTLAALTFSFQPVSADESVSSVEFSYAGNPLGAGGYSEPSYKGGAMLLTEAVTNRFDGCHITEVMVANGRFYNQSEAPIQIFFTDALDEKPFFSQSGFMDIDHPLDYKSYTLSAPMEIKAGEPFFVGFVTWAAGASYPDYEVSYPVWTDGVLHTDLPGGFIALSDTTGDPEKMQWNDEGYSGGQVCIRLKIEGDNLPKNVVELTSVMLSDYIDPSSEADAWITVSNNGVNPISDIDVSYSVFEETVSRHFDFLQPVEYADKADLCLAVSVSQEGVNIPITFTIEKINGIEPAYTSVASKGVTIHSILPENGFDRNLVVEEASGRGCGWCVRGMVGLDRMFKQYSDGSFIPISAHHIGYGEETNPFGYDPFWDRYITHNPSCLVNRNLAYYGIQDPSSTTLSWIYDEVTSSRAIADIKINGYSEKGGWLEVDSEATFAFSEEVGEYSVAYVVTEDEVGPYMQNNSYSGWDEDMDGWESLPSVVPTYYDFLARGISDFDGTPLYVDGGIEAGKSYGHSDKVNLVKVRDINKLTLIAMLINDKTGCIENAVRMPLTELEINSVEEVPLSNTAAEYYDLSGRRLMGNPGMGICIVRNGCKSRKMICGSNFQSLE